jgi:hypothetical protein
MHSMIPDLLVMIACYASVSEQADVLQGNSTAMTGKVELGAASKMDQTPTDWWVHAGKSAPVSSNARLL